MKKQFSYIYIATLLLLFSGCAAKKQFIPPGPVPYDEYSIPEPGFREPYNDFHDAFNQQFVLQGEQFLDLSRHIRTLANNPKEAYNLNAFDEVDNSSWFSNRNHKEPMSIESIIRGPNTGSGPDTSQTWTIIRAKAEGVTPGFTIVDSRGDKYVIKFDPEGHAGLNSGSEVIGSRIFYAAGFNVPENYICHFDPKILKLGEKVKFTDEKGRKRFMNEDDLGGILNELAILPNGLIRATASKYVEGKPIGPFRYEKTRRDDPNDIVPHEHRRELRGLRVIGAWLNHIDAKGANSMDTYYTDINGETYVRHYLIDFGTILGSGGRGPQPKYRGYENEIDPHALFLRLLTFGLYVPKWERVPDVVEYCSVGRYYSDYFQPEKFKIIFPNPAYDNLTARDGYWGAKIVMSFTDEQLKAIVEQAQYPQAGASEFLLKHLVERRNKTGEYWFKRMPPLDNFNLTDLPGGGQELRFDDLAVITGLESANSAVYGYTLYVDGEPVMSFREIGNLKVVPLPMIEEFRNLSTANPQWEIELKLRRNNSEKWSKSVRIYYRYNKIDEKYQFEGIFRES